MASSTLTFSQGQTATLTAQFVTTPAGMPIDVADATIEIFGSGGAVVLATTAMVHVVTGLYYYDYVIPNSLPVNVYTVRLSGTVLGTPTANTLYLNVVAAGSSLGSTSQSQAAAVAAMERYIGCAQRIPVEAELGRVLPDRDEVMFNWPRWNLTNPIIRLNDRMTTTGYAIDYDVAKLTFSSTLHETDKVDASYNFRWFSQEELVGYLNDALNRMNMEPPGTEYTLDNVPTQMMGVLLHGAASQAIQSMMFCIQFQKQKTVFGGPEEAGKVFSNLETLKQNHEKMFNEDRRKFKIARYPRIGAVVKPEFSLPGGRCISFDTNILASIDNETICLNIEQAYRLSLQKNLRVLSIKHGQLNFSKVSKIWKTTDKEAFEINSKYGKKTVASKDHWFFVNGIYKRVSSMRNGDSLLTLTSTGIKPDKVLSIRRLPDAVPMFDIEVPETGNLFANGIVCHNSRWFRYLYSSNLT